MKELHINSQSSSNVVLIGMPGAGKSTLGVLLAKHLAKRFTDTDILLQDMLGETLQDYLDANGYLNLREQEERMLLTHQFSDSVVATGGSVVYSEQGMQQLKSDAVLVYLSIRYETLLERVHNQSERGIACPAGTTLEQIFQERESLYQRYADVVVPLDGVTLEAGLEKVIKALNM
ncbi:Shikimate kinase 2 [Thalassocella blandensis]|nr:Shikimate kinase 2 [Thalassocella blandensis]